MALIYSADDEKEVRNIIKIFLENDGHQVVSFENGDSLLETFSEKAADLVLLDVMMPGTNGFMITNALRKISSVPIILLTAKDSDGDYIAGLSLGSDDYMTKPFKPSILVAKVNALLRRVQINETPKNDVLAFGNIEFDGKRHMLLCDNNDINVTNTELKFLEYMLARPNEAVAKEEVLDQIWGYSAEVETRVADETNRRLRKKLDQAGADVYVQTVWGYGFKLVRKEEN